MFSQKFKLSTLTGSVGVGLAVAGAVFCLPGSGPAAPVPEPQASRPVQITPGKRVMPNVKPRAQSAPAAESASASPAQNSLIEGFTEPYKDIKLAAPEMGTLAEIAVKDGDAVGAGQLLARLNDDVLTASLAVAKAGMLATGELKSAETQLRLKRVEFEKLTALFGRDHASQKELDRVTGEVQIAESRILSVKEDLEVRRLEHARIMAQMKQREIRSTIDGVVVEVQKETGEFVSPSDPVVARVVQLDPLLVVFSVPNQRRANVSKNQSVSMQIAGSGIAEGVVEHVSPTADASSGTFKVKVRLPNPDQRWHGGEKSVLLLDSDSGSASRQIAKSTK